MNVNPIQAKVMKASRQLPSAPTLSFEQLPWMSEALCTQVDPDLFYPDNELGAALPKKICGACPVRLACLAYAFEHDERHGVWGGLSEQERARARGGSAA